MSLNRNQFYFFLFTACIAGYLWIYYVMSCSETGIGFTGGCLIKHGTGLPCPSCGSTRSVISLVNGDFGNAFMINPLGFVIMFFLLIIPAWMIIDCIFRKNSLFTIYRASEQLLVKKKYAMP